MCYNVHVYTCRRFETGFQIQKMSHTVTTCRPLKPDIFLHQYDCNVLCFLYMYTTDTFT